MPLRRFFASLRVTRLVPSSHYVLLALLFFAGLETVFALHRWIFLLIVVLLLLLAYGIFLVRLEEGGRLLPTQFILPIFTASGLAGFSLFLPQTALIHLYFALASLVFYWLLRHGTKQAYPTWNWTLATIVYFLNIAIILGLRFHLYIPILLTLSIVFLISFLLCLQAVRRVAPYPLAAVLAGIGVGIALTELAWVLQFLPLHFLVQAGVLVAFYYILFNLISISYERKIEFGDLREYGVVGVLALVLILATARWT